MGEQTPNATSEDYRTDRRRFMAAAGGVAGFGLVGSASARSGPTSANSQDGTAGPEAPPLEVVDEEWLSDRLMEYTFDNPLVDPPYEQTNTRVFVPSDYHESERTYPALYLFHGGAGSAADWTTDDSGPGPLQNYFEADIVVVMPDGTDGWHSDWYNDGAFGAPKWETYHVHQLIPFIENEFRVRSNRQSRIAAGFSMGGAGSLTLGARHPDLYAGAYALSGSPYLIDYSKEVVESGDWGPGMVGRLGAWGDPRKQETRWKGHNAQYITENLQNTRVHVAVGDSGPVEPTAYEFGTELVERLAAANVEHDFYVNHDRGHSYEWAHQDIERLQDDFLEVFRRDPVDPSGFNYRSIEPSFDVWGWQVNRPALTRETAEFLDLENVTADGFTVTGSGKIEFVTPGFYEPQDRFAVTADGHASSVSPGVVTADDGGRLSFTVRAGPPAKPRGNVPDESAVSDSKTVDISITSR
ncbi:alpha/beta hydrolase-fold protein [Halostagnicola sp. A-GB9-2]|uniref:alpha/beta hydrolase n=1 Tax=Halostagnicola sp. A-GB9-2 TaxID=3048066 RepID=UPI0024BF36CE|nr:alpha/beta hydrolase-fold protein [Halostagnicola sp. A-GB9-2]MDJ1433822.1 alpha/beta hydrolase-fold protein [Halostagnicola sp. A-GB9-2]